MSSQHCHHNSSNSLNTLLLGALLGAGFILLFGTKRGKELAQDLADKGLLALEDFEGLLTELQEETGELEEIATPPPPPTTQISNPLPVHPPAHHSQKDYTIRALNNYPTSANISIIESSPTPASYLQSIQEQGRRFFRGIPKRN